MRWVVAGAMVAAVCAGAALAQTVGTATERAGPSFLRILVEGAEIPGAIILLMSVAAVAIIIEQFRTVRRSTMAPVDEIEAARELIESRRFKECVARLQDSRSMFAAVLLSALRHGRHGFDAMQEAAEETAGAWTSRLFRRAEYLNILGNLGPLMGLLGTVLGMIRAFSRMQETHGAYKPEDLAGGIGLALVNTFLGLGLAIVALGFFGVCRNRVDALSVSASASAVELLEYFRPSTAGGVAAVSRPPKVEPTAAAARSGVIGAGAAQPASQGAG